MKLMRKLPDDTKKLISDAIKSGSAPISCKDARKKKGKKGVVKATAVNAYAADSLAGVELFVNTLNSDPMPGIAVVDAWGYDGSHDFLIALCGLRSQLHPVFPIRTSCQILLVRSSVYRVDMLKVAVMSLNQICRECTFLSTVSACFFLSFVSIMKGRR
jgi:hypothetical protein